MLHEWVFACPHYAIVERTLLFLDEGSEHTVFSDPVNQSVIKFTREGTFGDSYYVLANRVYQSGATPAEYLLRQHLVLEHFGFSQRPLGVTETGQIVSRQRFVRGAKPSQAETDAYLLAAGLEPVKLSCWLWKKTNEELGTEDWVGDARADNFVSTEAGIIPIDLRMWRSPIE